MAQIINFPNLEDREWKEWEQSIRQSCIGTSKDERVVADAIPRIREHWDAVFEDITLELPKRPVPGKLTRNQAVVIQELIDSSAALVVNRLKNERSAAMERLIRLELELSYCRVYGGRTA